MAYGELWAEAPSTVAKLGCYRCGNPNDVIDFDVYIEGEGFLGVCERCFDELARTLGYRQPIELKRLRAEKARLTAQVHALENALAQERKTTRLLAERLKDQLDAEAAHE